ncbi:MarR family winged helix-turn-helix transcriptional regulator [Streptococcus ictaluri]|uniref:Sugar-specific transcriptional regulator, TrmB family n=1 Tax=Streptococcus ictaluri 707-05 TaxID=764299 RepID=G5K5W8_9STRE|nr:MarR family transcriptional regulator [Streptococcus ictaluri]EHI68591.1 sugar-specific transcriptional regulator, TrmB family [Streptococcus ictaluri 707-05]EHI70947.1 sugar-specific transcriptional regulator, TrmB family [Streptococcus ictaluri 707-05]
MREKNTVYLIKRANLSFDKIANKVLTPHGITHSQFKCLKYLYLFDNGSRNQRDIENYFNMSNPTVTRILQNLEKEGWLQRLANGKDKRQKQLYLTKKALDYQGVFKDMASQLEDQLTERLTDAELDKLQELLRKMLAISLKD